MHDLLLIETIKFMCNLYKTTTMKINVGTNIYDENFKIVNM